MEVRGIRCWWGEGSGAAGEKDQVLEGRGIRNAKLTKLRKSLKQHVKVFFSDKKVFQLKLFATGGQIQYIMVFQNTFLCTFSI